MDTRWIFRAAAIMAVAALGVTGWVVTGQSAEADAPAVTAAQGVAVVISAQAEEEKEGEKKEEAQAEFVGSGKCKMCHMKEYKSWEETKHAKALDALKPGEAKEAKEAAKLDPEKDYTKDKECIGCHVTGFAKPGGFELKDDEKEMEKMVKDFGHVGCEACHGAGEPYMDFHKTIMKEKKEYTDEEMKKMGTLKGGEAQCKECHNDKSPTFKEFNYEEAVKDKNGVHEHQDLKYRKEG